MAEAIVSVALEKLLSVTAHLIQQEVRLVRDVDKEVKNLGSHLGSIRAVLLDAEQKQVKNASLRVWLDKLKDASYDLEDVLDAWITVMMKPKIEGVDHENALLPKKVCFFFPSRFCCFGVKQVFLRRDFALKIKEINENLVAIAKEKDTYNLVEIRPGEKVELVPSTSRVPSTPIVDVDGICGRDVEKNNLVNKLLCESPEGKRGIHIISIVGIGGIGKTTLAQFAYNDIKVINNFDKKAWVYVSNPFDQHRIARAIIEALEGSPSTLVEFDPLMQKILASIKGKRFLLVLDDVWTDKHRDWEPFDGCLKNGLHGSKILVTTRNKRVAEMMNSDDIIDITKLSDSECWSLFSRLAFSNKSSAEKGKLEETGREIVRRCKGLPLAIKTIGSLLQFQKTREAWQVTLDSEMWELQDFDKGLLPSLLLSYNDLDSMVKRCFLYCSIFPKGYRMVKDRLIKLWMAQDYLRSKSNEMEITGETYFDHLAKRSLFQDFFVRFVYEYSCKMHDIVHDFVQFISNNEILSIEVSGNEDLCTNSSDEKVSHLMLILNKDASFPKSIYHFKRLRSLLISCIDFDLSQFNDVLSELFGKLTSLRALDIGAMLMPNDLILEIPNGIEKLIHLRYLNLEKKNVEKLPEALCELYNLQTLNVTRCKRLKELPQALGKLSNLRHLMNFHTISLSHMPRGVKNLTCLRELREFVVSGNDSKAATLLCLKDFNNLRGYLRIRGLDNVTNVSDFKGKQVLQNKKNLTELSLQFNEHEEVERLHEDEFVLDALQPPSNLEKLWIEWYKGNTFPSNWMMSLTWLTHLYLRHCSNCENLSPLALGKLPSLEALELTGMKTIKRIDSRFWGVESEFVSSSSSAIFFPRLKELVFSNMSEWEEWDYRITMQTDEAEMQKAIFMPCLASLQIRGGCRKLKLLPESLLQRTTLERLGIKGSPILQKRYTWKTGEDWPKISHIPVIEIKRQKFLQGKPLSGISRPSAKTLKSQATVK